PMPDGIVRSFDPPELRDVIVIMAAPHDDLVRRFVAALKQRGLPDSRASLLRPPTLMAIPALPVLATFISAMN
ncbi:MAG: hypothetical protein ACRDN0_25540, partial [Trebonia sp.]